MAKILGIGIATLDIINYVSDYPAEDSEVRCTKQTICRGGNVTNTLTILSQLEHECYWAGTLADEPDAKPIINSLQKYSINLSYVTTFNNGKVPTSYILINEKNGSRSIVHHRELEEYNFNEFKLIPFEEFDWVHFEARNINETSLMLDFLKQHHPNILCSVEFEKPRPGIECLLSYPDILIFSKSYCEKTSGTDPKKFLEKMHLQHPNKTMVLAWGDKGSYAIDDNKSIIFSPSIKAENVVETLGAGDTFNAAIIHNLLREKSLRDTLLEANKLASYKVSKTGFDISDFNE